MRGPLVKKPADKTPAPSGAEAPRPVPHPGTARRLSPTTLAAASAVQRHHADRLAARLRAVPPPADE